MWINFDAQQLEALKRITVHTDIASPDGHADAALIQQRISHYEDGAQRDLPYIAVARALPFARAGSARSMTTPSFQPAMTAPTSWRGYG